MYDIIEKIKYLQNRIFKRLELVWSVWGLLIRFYPFIDIDNVCNTVGNQ